MAEVATTMEDLPMQELVEHVWRALPADVAVRSRDLAKRLAHPEYPASGRIDEALRQLKRDGRARQVGGWWAKA